MRIHRAGRTPRAMWIVRLALRRPYTFVVMGLTILLLGVFAIVTTPTDIFPEIEIPVVSVIWNYDGLTSEDMASRITTFSEYTISSAVSDVRTIESQTYPGVAVIKIYLHPNVKLGPREYRVSLNSSPDAVAALNDLPVKYVNGAVVYVRDVAHVRDGFAVQTNIVRQDGRRSALLTVIKKGGASTLTIVKQLRELLPTIRAAAPPGMEIKELFDQSLFVRAAIAGVLTEGAIAAFLTGLMILLFLGSWRSTLVVITSIPLSILTSLAILSAIGQTLNVMTLGGLALAVAILVDDATVEIENIHRNLGLGTRLVQAILDDAQQIATPAFVSTLSICIVFVPVVFLTGPAKYLFTPLAMAVVFAMLASYLLSRTIVPTLVRSEEHT